jgi:anti-sigma factor ChrR (cupin superfamily)
MDLLTELALGTLPEPERAEIEAALAGSPALRQELERMREAVTGAALALDPMEPSPGARQRLMKALDGPDRFGTFFEALARLFDLPAEAMRAVLARIDDAGAWVDALPGTKLIDFAAGPGLGAADAGLVRLEPGAAFPRHRHLGDETTLVLEGTMIDGGVSYRPGSVVKHAFDSVHDYSAGAERPLVIAVLHHGIEPL